ncbi:hypothetical protein AX16_006559 [Volvariella volvacea WC 439]|nr:hypothetical protein AX16_006559 [Volvariella volvacea WC 439]
MPDSRLPRHSKQMDDPKMIGLWKVGRTIGKGSSGRVRIARHSKTGQYAAIKIISKSNFSSRKSKVAAEPTEQQQSQLAIEREIVVMKLISHPNIMRLYDVWETSTELYLVLEYIQGGELFEYLCNKGRLPTLEALNYFQQIIGAVDYCHRFNICHRDLKPENILLDQDHNVKIADFGMAAWFANSEGGLLHTSCGSPHYAAPEIITGSPYRGSASDIWSCGVVLHALLAGKLPFDDEDCVALLEKVVKGKFVMPPDIDPLAKDLISKMLTTEVPKRITMSKILAHPFFNLAKPKILRDVVPNLEDIARPLKDVNSIDPDILANLRTLWHGMPDEELIQSLTDNKQTWQKGVYHLLVEYRVKRLQGFEREEEEIARIRSQRKKAKREKGSGKAKSQGEVQTASVSQSQQHANATTSPRPSLSDLPPRAAPPTPRRASHQREALSPSAIDLSIVKNPLASIPAPSTSSPGQPPPIPSALTPLLEALKLPAALNSPELQDEKVQAFFYQLAEHLAALQARTGTPDLTAASPNLTLITELLSTQLSGKHDISTTVQGKSTWDNEVGDTGRPIGVLENGTTRPLSVRRKTKPQQRPQSLLGTDWNMSDKENGVPPSQAQGPLRNKFAEDNRYGTQTSNTIPDGSKIKSKKAKRVLIIEPSERFSLRRKKSYALQPSPVLSDTGTGSSFTLPSPTPSPSSPSPPFSSFSSHSHSPKRRWFSNVFKFRIPTPIFAGGTPRFMLYSMFDAYTSRNECRRILMGMNVRVILEGVEGLGVLKCRLDDVKDIPSWRKHPDQGSLGYYGGSGAGVGGGGKTSGLKAVRFRAEVLRIHSPGSVSSRGTAIEDSPISSPAYFSHSLPTANRGRLRDRGRFDAGGVNSHFHRHHHDHGQPARERIIALHFVHERGSVETFKEIQKRLEREWKLDEPGGAPSNSVLPSPTMVRMQQHRLRQERDREHESERGKEYEREQEQEQELRQLRVYGQSRSLNR